MDRLRENPENLDTETQANISQPAESVNPKKFSRRRALKLMAGAAVGGGLVLGGYDKLSQTAHEYLGPEVEGTLPNVIEKIKTLFPEASQWTDSTEWAPAIYQACEKNQIPPTTENLAMILTLIMSESGFRTSPRALDFWSTPAEKLIEKTGLVKPLTGGPMEVTIGYVMDQEKLTYEEALQKLSTISDGVGYGVSHLKKIIDINQSIPDKRLQLECTFADYNAGLFASRNAGIQALLNKMQASGLREDGLLFSKTANEIEKFSSARQLPLTSEQIRKDLTHTVNFAFAKSPTWQALEAANGGEMPVVSADRPVLGLAGFMKKQLTDVGSSREFAQHRLAEFDQIVKLFPPAETKKN